MSKTKVACAVMCALAALFGPFKLQAQMPGAKLVQLAELTPSARAKADWFGISIAVSGNTVVVGDFDLNIESYGTVYVYVKPANGWQNMTQVAQLSSSDNAVGFGTSVAISGSTIVVGAANASNFDGRGLAPPSASPGAAYVFVEPPTGWTDTTESAKLSASDGQPGDAFGNSVSISGNTIAVGALFAEDSAGNSFAGKAYVFERPEGGWGGKLNQTAELTASDSQLLNHMGASIEVSGSTVVAGAYGHNNFQGAAYVFSEPSGGWANMTQTAELSASNGKSSDDFGFAAAISDNTVVIGAPNVASKGAAYVFVEPADGWTNATQTAELHAVGEAAGASFGESAGISGRVIVIGAPGTTVNGNLEQGAAYFFVEPSSGWTSSKGMELTASDGGANDTFGASAAISGTTVVAGAPAGNAPGSAYVFGP
ncbi:MAG TPA: hypothetical protein VMF10_15205 [Candidatus Aquilonibacter sp.]|nr:hypothetical protein [Candidatus Aquilonibacter sp.]